MLDETKFNRTGLEECLESTNKRISEMSPLSLRKILCDWDLIDQSKQLENQELKEQIFQVYSSSEANDGAIEKE